MRKGRPYKIQARKRATKLDPAKKSSESIRLSNGLKRERCSKLIILQHRLVPAALLTSSYLSTHAPAAELLLSMAPTHTGAQEHTVAPYGFLPGELVLNFLLWLSEASNLYCTLPFCHYFPHFSQERSSCLYNSPARGVQADPPQQALLVPTQSPFGISPWTRFKRPVFLHQGVQTGVPPILQSSTLGSGRGYGSAELSSPLSSPGPLPLFHPGPLTSPRFHPSHTPS